MQSLDKQQFLGLIQRAHVKPRLAKDLRFVPDNYAWEDYDFVAINTKSTNEGVLVIELSEHFVLPFTLSTRLVDKQTGRSKPITCDFCYTWQQGGKAARITFVRPSDEHSLTFLCCGDLRCSLHVRDLTAEAALSRTQLHEDMTTDQRIARLHKNLTQILTDLGYITEHSSGSL